MRRIYPRGTPAKDVPPDFRGISWDAWLCLQVVTPPSTPADVARWSLAHPLQTPRDDYGWRGSRAFVDRTPAALEKRAAGDAQSGAAPKEEAAPPDLGQATRFAGTDDSRDAE